MRERNILYLLIVIFAMVAGSMSFIAGKVVLEEQGEKKNSPIFFFDNDIVM